ncbi:MAG: type II toxin-antitoxin system RelE/ParE family toxin [Alphaproteobacteria bacterium]|nr:type II toxin-antitoxin system RelE/ParE family toxin [Alphaproteobacteria bacterium]
MAWTIEFSIKAERQLAKIDHFWQKKIATYLKEKVKKDPLAFGKALTSNLKGLWRYRIGDYRVICELNGKQLTVLVVDVGHRKGVYE